MIVGCAIYADGRRVAAPADVVELSAACREDGKLVWLGLHEPTADEFADVAREFDLHELAVEDTVTPISVRSSSATEPRRSWCCVRRATSTRPKRSSSARSTVFVGPQFVITVRHGEASELHRVREALEGRPDLLRRGPVAIMHAIVDRVVDDYAPVVAGVENDIGLFAMFKRRHWI